MDALTLAQQLVEVIRRSRVDPRQRDRAFRIAEELLCDQDEVGVPRPATGADPPATYVSGIPGRETTPAQDHLLKTARDVMASLAHAGFEGLAVSEVMHVVQQLAHASVTPDAGGAAPRSDRPASPGD